MIRSSRAFRALLGGAPRVGKSTVVDQLVKHMRARGVPLTGIVTREVRVPDERVGFEMEDLASGTHALLAHIDFPDGPTVGRYGVDLDALDRVATLALNHTADSDAVMIIDELGPMQLLSYRFVGAVDAAFESRVPLVGTVHRGRHPVSDRWKALPDVELIEVTAANRAALHLYLAERLAAGSD